MLRESLTTLVERNQVWQGRFESEPCEAAWATEAIYFVRALAREGSTVGAVARVQLSPDGMHWCDEGSEMPLPSEAEGVSFVRIRHFGSWLRLVGELPEGTQLTVIAYLVLKE
jgi:hypothetical protein